MGTGQTVVFVNNLLEMGPIPLLMGLQKSHAGVPGAWSSIRAVSFHLDLGLLPDDKEYKLPEAFQGLNILLCLKPCYSCLDCPDLVN